MRDYRDAKTMAHALRDALKDRAVETTHSESLELIARVFGYENWNILAAKIAAAEIRSAAAPVPSPGAKAASADETLYCSFCGKSQHDVKKLIAGPLVYICDECVELCTEIVRDDDPFWKVLTFLAAAENNGSDAYPAALEYFHGKSTEQVASFVQRSRQAAEHYRLMLRSIGRKLAMRHDQTPAQDDFLASPGFAHLNGKSRKELLGLQEETRLMLKRCEDALRIGTRALGEREGQGSA